MNSVDHHFSPQFYLRGFRDPHVLDGQEPWRWIVDFEESTVQRRAPKNVGKKANYYAFPEVETVGESIESVFSKLESAAAPVIKELVVSDNAALEGHDRADQIDLGGLLFLMRIARGGTSSFGPHPR
jgi:Protein of unknown function (DUF4238)